MKKTIILLLAGVFLFACAKPTEEQRLSKFRGSMKYKSYRLASEKAASLVADEYNKKSAEPVDDVFVHSMLGLLWLVSGNSDFCFIEADILNTGQAGETRTENFCLKTVALYKMKYPELSKSHYEELKRILAVRENTGTDSIEEKHKVMLLTLAVAGLYYGDRDLAKFGGDALGTVTRLDYVPPLVGVLAEARNGSLIKAAGQFRELNKSERFSRHERAVFAEFADIIAEFPGKDKLGDELENRVLKQLALRVLEDIFTTEDKRLLLEKTKTVPELIMGWSSAGRSTEAQRRHER